MDIKANGPCLKVAESMASECIYVTSFIFNADSNNIIAVKSGSPLVLGVRDKGMFVASDVPSFLKYTNKVVYLSAL